MQRPRRTQRFHAKQLRRCAPPLFGEAQNVRPRDRKCYSLNGNRSKGPGKLRSSLLLPVVFTLLMARPGALFASEISLQEVFDRILVWFEEARESHPERVKTTYREMRRQLIGHQLIAKNVSVRAKSLSYDSSSNKTSYSADLMLKGCDPSGDYFAGVRLDTKKVGSYCSSPDSKTGRCWDFSLALQKEGKSLIMNIIGRKGIMIEGVISDVRVTHSFKDATICGGLSERTHAISIEVGVEIAKWE